MPIATQSVSYTEPRVRAAIASAADRTGMDFGFLYNQARVESGLNPAAKARSSSAAGLYQFTRQTWLRTIKAHGADHGLGWAADAIANGGGRLGVTDITLKNQVEGLRFDPNAAASMAAELAADNRDELQNALGRPVEPVELYLAHFLGARGAIDFARAYEANPTSVGAPLFPAAAAANRAIFFTKTGTARTLEAIRADFSAKLEGASPSHATAVDSQLIAWTQSLHTSSATSSRNPLELARIEPIPVRPSPDFAARAYARLSGIGA